MQYTCSLLQLLALQINRLYLLQHYFSLHLCVLTKHSKNVNLSSWIIVSNFSFVQVLYWFAFALNELIIHHKSSKLGLITHIVSRNWCGVLPMLRYPCSSVKNHTKIMLGRKKRYEWAGRTENCSKGMHAQIPEVITKLLATMLFRWRCKEYFRVKDFNRTFDKLNFPRNSELLDRLLVN